MKRAILALLALVMLAASPAMGADKHPDDGEHPKLEKLCNAIGQDLEDYMVSIFPPFKGDLALADKIRKEVCAAMTKFDKPFRSCNDRCNSCANCGGSWETCHIDCIAGKHPLCRQACKSGGWCKVPYDPCGKPDCPANCDKEGGKNPCKKE